MKTTASANDNTNVLCFMGKYLEEQKDNTNYLQCQLVYHKELEKQAQEEEDPLKKPAEVLGLLQLFRVFFYSRRTSRKKQCKSGCQVAPDNQREQQRDGSGSRASKGIPPPARRADCVLASPTRDRRQMQGSRLAVLLWRHEPLPIRTDWARACGKHRGAGMSGSSRQEQQAVLDCWFWSNPHRPHRGTPPSFLWKPQQNTPGKEGPPGRPEPLAATLLRDSNVLVVPKTALGWSQVVASRLGLGEMGWTHPGANLRGLIPGPVAPGPVLLLLKGVCGRWRELSVCAMAVLRHRRGLWGSEPMSHRRPSKAGELGACPLRHQAFQKPPPRRRLLKGLVHQRTGTQLPRDRKRGAVCPRSVLGFAGQLIWPEWQLPNTNLCICYHTLPSLGVSVHTYSTPVVGKPRLTSHMRLFGPLSVLTPLLQNRLAQAENRLLRMGHEVSIALPQGPALREDPWGQRKAPVAELGVADCMAARTGFPPAPVFPLATRQLECLLPADRPLRVPPPEALEELRVADPEGAPIGGWPEETALEELGVADRAGGQRKRRSDQRVARENWCWRKTGASSQAPSVPHCHRWSPTMFHAAPWWSAHVIGELGACPLVHQAFQKPSLGASGRPMLVSLVHQAFRSLRWRGF
ncbi:hypothetical protein QTO34_014790 [Cnephaeus nilssonii]|uniref:Uncharacterized protein n=1 Tax=Cnephaeus nilssonii TaxID=3371016 RepID=A0AA40I814_CNENI|nr:hypothetical protein QTO34_014790 [Eptesicus nilssonii]